MSFFLEICITSHLSVLNLNCQSLPQYSKRVRFFCSSSTSSLVSLITLYTFISSAKSFVQEVMFLETLGPFIRRKIRRFLNKTRPVPFIQHALSKTRTARINGSRLIAVLDFFLCECCPWQRQSNVARRKLTHAYYAFASYLRREGRLYKVFLVLAKTRLI